MTEVAIALVAVAVLAWDMGRRHLEHRTRLVGQEYADRLTVLEKQVAANHEEMKRQHAAVASTLPRVGLAGLGRMAQRR